MSYIAPSTMTRTQRVLVLKIAVAILRHMESERRKYEEHVRYHARNGHIPHYCIHGANLWVDHDIPCGACEAGYDDREIALMEAGEAFRDWMRRMDAYRAFRDTAGNLPSELDTAMWEWINEPIGVLDTYPRPHRNLP